MRKHLIALGLGLFAALSATNAAANPPYIRCEADRYPLACRGPLSYSVQQYSTGGGTYELNAASRRSERAAGQDGAQVGNGQCGWLDRRLEPAEPTRLRMTFFEIAGQRPGIFGGEQMMTRLEQCLSTSGCLVIVCARTDAGIAANPLIGEPVLSVDTRTIWYGTASPAAPSFTVRPDIVNPRPVVRP